MATEDSKQKSVIGKVYSSLRGNVLAEETEYNIGWLQVSKGKRVKVAYKRISHSCCGWQRVLEEK